MIAATCKGRESEGKRSACIQVSCRARCSKYDSVHNDVLEEPGVELGTPYEVRPFT